jgi:predicted nucleotidyltransferase
VTLVRSVAAHLAQEQVPFALVGAAALAAHGVSRSTLDLDLLTTEQRVLHEAFWSAIAATADVRRGDQDDPLAGVIRISTDGERDVDVVVGRFRWQTEILARALPIVIEGVSLPVACAVDLVLLKLYAGGRQDAWDIEQLLAAGDRRTLVIAIDAAVEPLPLSARKLWERLRDSSDDD